MGESGFIYIVYGRTEKVAVRVSHIGMWCIRIFRNIPRSYRKCTVDAQILYA